MVLQLRVFLDLERVPGIDNTIQALAGLQDSLNIEDRSAANMGEQGLVELLAQFDALTMPHA